MKAETKPGSSRVVQGVLLILLGAMAYQLAATSGEDPSVPLTGQPAEQTTHDVAPIAGSEKASEAGEEAKVKDVSVEEAVMLIEKSSPLLLDVRTPFEYKRGHLEGTILVPVNELEDRLSELEQYKNKPILVYCRSGSRSTTASKVMLNNGFKQVYNLRGGITEWEREGNAVSKE